ncbi:uncharacterized protein LOC130731663 [Lotus japonicus]|uniref:uncharacterized protein LOC130731663 n=1 Tax=Lotus japonicus TaxID=34305 RepID=UPI0025831A0F|nr:uncharacterized protein LOC130731663 [Lotus japonicus]
MDPPEFDLEAYLEKSKREDTYVLNHFRERRNLIFEDNAPRGRKHLSRDHAGANQRLIADYFANEPTYDDGIFRRRYRMQKHVFLRIVADLSSSDNYFTQRVDVAKKEADAVDEYIKIGETTTLECLRRFCKGIIRLYEQEYMRAPTQEDLQRILQVSEMRGFPGMIGSIDCMHWEWKNCPKAWEADGIYPSYPTFVKSIRLPQTEPDKCFAKHQEGCRKDIERAFGVLQARFKIIREPARFWDITDLGIIMRSCIILHNMIVEDERDSYAQRWTDFEQAEGSGSSTPQPYSTEVLPAFADHVRARSEFRDPNVHHQLQADLVKHIWAKFGMYDD